MQFLTRQEEMVLLAVWQLKTNAYGVSITEKLSEMTGSNWVLKAIYLPLERLEQKGYLRSVLSEPLATRGGRSKRLYFVTKAGIKALLETRQAQESIWDKVSRKSLESEI